MISSRDSYGLDNRGTVIRIRAGERDSPPPKKKSFRRFCGPPFHYSMGNIGACSLCLKLLWSEADH